MKTETLTGKVIEWQSPHGDRMIGKVTGIRLNGDLSVDRSGYWRDGQWWASTAHWIPVKLEWVMAGDLT